MRGTAGPASCRPSSVYPCRLLASYAGFGGRRAVSEVPKADVNNYVYTMLSVYGKTPAEVETIRAKWQPWLEQLLGVEAHRM